MLISLPVKINEKSSSIVFQVNKSDNNFIITPYNKNNLIKVITCNEYGINTVSIYFPLTFTVISNNMLICDLFLVIDTLSDSNDFFSLLIQGINTFYNKKYIYFNNIKQQAIINTIKLNTENDNTECKSVGNLIHRIFLKINRYLNFSLSMMLANENNSVLYSSKVVQIINTIKQQVINFYGNEMSVDEHMQHIINRELIKKNKKYFVSNDSNIKLMSINNCKNITNITTYPPKFNQYIKLDNLIKYLIVYRYNKMIEIVANIIYKKNPIYIKLALSIESNDNLTVLKNLSNNIKVYEEQYIQYKKDIPDDISFDKFKELVDLEPLFNIDILKNLFINLTNMLNYNKKLINPTFAKILYYSFKYYNNILAPPNQNKDDCLDKPSAVSERLIKSITKSDCLDTWCNNSILNSINYKIKSTYLFILKIYKLLDTNESTIFNIRIYTDSFVNMIIKILLFNDTFNLFSNISTKIPKIQKIFIENTTIYNILSNLTWKNISKQINQFKYVVDMKPTHNMLYIVDDKINKYIVTSMDNRLKKIIIDPLIMFSYLKKESDYYKWIINFKDYIRKIFYNPIILQDIDYIKISKFIYLLSKVDIQSLDNQEYNRLINYLRLNPSIIMFNDRINIKLKYVCKNINFNLGFLAKHINEYIEKTPISITEEDDNIKQELDKITRKYYKYKGRYLEIKSK